MKTKIIILLICLTSGTALLAQKNLFDKYADMDGFTSVFISKSMFEMMPSIETGGLNLINMKGKIESLQILNTERKDQIATLKKDFDKLISGKHEELMRVKDDSTRVNFYILKSGDKVKELIMTSSMPNQFTVMQLLGNFTLKDIQQITEQAK